MRAIPAGNKRLANPEIGVSRISPARGFVFEHRAVWVYR